MRLNPSLDRAIDLWLERLGLSAWLDKKIDSLSKGMAQKVQFIAGVLNKPRLLILDEPFSGLDPVNTEVLRDAVLDLKKAGTTIVFSTHDMQVAERLCDRIFMIFKGRKVLDGTLDEIQSIYGFDTVRLETDLGATCARRPCRSRRSHRSGQSPGSALLRRSPAVARKPDEPHQDHAFRGRPAVAARHLRANRRARKSGARPCTLIREKSGSSRRPSSGR